MNEHVPDNFERDVAVEYARVQVGEVIAGLMQDEGVSKEQVAKAADCTAAEIQKMLEGEVATTVDTLAAMMHGFQRRLVLDSRGDDGLAPAEAERAMNAAVLRQIHDLVRNEAPQLEAALGEITSPLPFTAHHELCWRERALKAEAELEELRRRHDGSERT